MADPGKPHSSSRNPNHLVKAAAWIAATLLLALAAAYPAYPGSFNSYLLFNLSFVAMLLLTLPHPRSHSYFFFAFMLFLGFWSKLMAHLLFGIEFLEPIGNFSGSGAEWDRALQVSAMGAVGLAIARLIYLMLAARYQPAASAVAYPPSWYIEWRKPVWIASLLAMPALYLLNLQAAFYQTGVNPKLIFPFHLNVLLGWLISIGFALWFAVLIHWEFERAPRSLSATLLVPIIESLASSTSALSRSFYLLHSLSYFVTVGTQWSRARAVLSWRTITCLTALWVLCFAISLTTVSWLRIKIYMLAYEPALVSILAQESVTATPATPSAGATMSNQIIPMMREVSRLFLKRWIGLEGVLAVSSYRDIGSALFQEGITESPKKGNDSLYQRVSKAQYHASDRFTFLTLPGIVGVLFYSGSLAMVVAGTFLVTLLMIGTERTALRLTANPFLASVMALGMAIVAAQINFPYLSVIFLAQLWVAIAFVWLITAAPEFLHRRRSESSPRA